MTKSTGWLTRWRRFNSDLWIDDNQETVVCNLQMKRFFEVPKEVEHVILYTVKEPTVNSITIKKYGRHRSTRYLIQMVKVNGTLMPVFPHAYSLLDNPVNYVQLGYMFPDDMEEITAEVILEPRPIYDFFVYWFAKLFDRRKR